MELNIVSSEEKKGVIFKKTLYYSRVTLKVSKDERRIIDGKRLFNEIFVKTKSADGAEVEIKLIEIIGDHTFEFNDSNLRDDFQKNIIANKDKLQTQVHTVLVAELNEAIKNSPRIKENIAQWGKPRQPAPVSPETAAKAKLFYNALKAITESGDNQIGHDYVLKHAKDFPEEVQKEITFVIFENAVNSKDQPEPPKTESKLPQLALDLLAPYLA